MKSLFDAKSQEQFRSEKMMRQIYLALKIWHDEGPITLLAKIKERLLRFSDYQIWIRNNEPRYEQLADQVTQVNKFGYRPLISLVLPVWNTPKTILNRTISSVMQQTYGNWELCIADGDSSFETQKILSDWAKKDARIKIKYLEENHGIAVNSNEALSLAQGEFVAFLDHDDLIAPFALFEIVNWLQRNQSADVIYSDEDKINKHGWRSEPFFKPDFNPDYLRGINYMTHFLVVRKTLGDQIAWFREGYDGAQDYDLILRLIEKARGIIHIPKVLYHWRVWAASAASSMDTKPYANMAGKEALQEHLNRIGRPAAVEDGYSPTLYRVQYRYSNTTLISIIIPNQDHALDLRKCLDSILPKTTYPNFEIVLIENGSKEHETFELYEQLKDNPKIHLVKWDHPFNYSSMNNWAAEQANGQVILFLNNDIQVINADWLEQMLQFAIRPDVGAVGAKLYYPDGTIQHGGIVIGIGGIAGHAHKYFPKNHPGYFRQLVLPHNVSAVTAACLMIRKEVFEEVNGFDKNYPRAFGDVDLCLNVLQKGYLNVWTPYAELYHYESKTRGKYDKEEKKRTLSEEIEWFKLKWSGILEHGDEYYNPNLTLSSEDFRINPNPTNESFRMKVKSLRY